MRDILLISIIALIVIVSIPRPYIGVLAMVWLSFMSPHQYSWSLRDAPILDFIFPATLIGLIFTKDKSKFYSNSTIFFILLLYCQITLTTFFFAMNPDGAYYEWQRFSKILLVLMLIIILINNYFKIKLLVIITCFSFAFYGIKGGIFSIATGGQFRVSGPPSSFIGDNNGLAMALVITLPLLLFFCNSVTKRIFRIPIIIATLLCFISLLLTFSRGGFTTLALISLFYLFHKKLNYKVLLAALFIIPVILFTIPEKWMDRMKTISNYEEDASAIGRINAWHFAFNLAKDYPLTGGGARVFTPYFFLSTPYAPDPEDYHDAHSIYFEILGEQGWAGLILFLMVHITALIRGIRLEKLWRIQGDNKEKALLVRCLWYSHIMYLVDGLFIGLAYFDLPYTILIIQALLERDYKQHIATINENANPKNNFAKAHYKNPC